MSDPLSEQDRDLLARAAELHQPLARAARTAHFNGGILFFFGGLTILLGVFGPDYVSLLLGSCVAGVGILERRNAVRLRNAEADAPRLLARNELILMGALVLYSLLALTVLRPTGEEFDKALGGAMSGLDVKAFADSLVKPVYLTMIAVALLYQGGMARYYLRRRHDIERFVGEIPEWARTVVQQMAG